MGNCVASSAQGQRYATNVPSRVYIYGAGEDRVNGTYKLKGKRKWRNSCPVYRNSAGFELSYEIIANQGGWMIGKYAVAMYGAKTNSTELPVHAHWTIFSGLEPAPDVALTKLEADKMRAGHFRDRVLKKNSFVQKNSLAAVRQENNFDNVASPTSMPKTARSQFVDSPAVPKTARSQFLGFAPRPEDQFQNYNLPNHQLRQDYHHPKVVHSPFKPNRFKNRRDDGDDENAQPNPLNDTQFERVPIDTKYARQEKERLEQRKREAQLEAEKFKAEQEAYLAQMNTRDECYKNVPVARVVHMPR